MNADRDNLFPFVRTACSVVLAVCLLSGCGTETPAKPRVTVLNHSIYVWQRQWTDDVIQSIQQAAPSVEHFLILAGELERAAGQWKCTTVEVDWTSFAAAGKRVWLVYRIHAGGLEEQGWPARSFAGLVAGSVSEARSAGVDVEGVQVDYDCPTEHLARYREWLREVSKHLQDTAISITALPAWLTQPAFTDLVSGLDHFVLQLHSLEKPVSADSAYSLCNVDNFPRWMEQASRARIPFYVALPTYGYRVYFDGTGAFSGVGAEAPREAPRGHGYRDVYADPEVMAAAVTLMMANPLNCFHGIAWFRLPVRADRMNWTWPVLQQVMKGETPEYDLAAELRSPQEGLFELWIAGRAEYLANQVCVTLRCDGGEIRASDVVNGFLGEGKPGGDMLCIRGPGPKDAEPRMAAWWVVQPLKEGVPAVLNVEEVKSCP